MLLGDLENRLCEELESKLEGCDFELVTLCVVGPKSAPILRIYIDVEGGVSFEQLAKAQGLIAPILDEIDPFEGAYTLEVSSPGIDRPLRKLSDFDRFAGEIAHIRTQVRQDDRRSFKGELKGTDGDRIQIEVDGKIYSIDFDDIQRANLVAQVF